MTIFKELKLDIVVMGVSRGGRLDAINAIPGDAVVVSTLTNVDLDHQEFLGNMVAEIAREKVGIARRGKPFVLGRQRFPEVEEAVRNTVLGDNIQGHLVRAVDPVGLPSKDPRGPAPVRSPAFLNYSKGNSPEFLTHSSCSHLKLSGRTTPETFAAGPAKTS